MAQANHRTKFWVILALINIAAIIYPVGLYVQADSNETQLLAVIALSSVAFLLAIADMVSAIVVYME